jgi:putative endonuclease
MRGTCNHLVGGSSPSRGAISTRSGAYHLRGCPFHLLKASGPDSERVERPKRLEKEKNMPAWVYILRLKSGQLYIGSTTDLNQRYKDHCSGKACRTTKFDPPVGLVYSEELNTFSEVRKREAQVKRWTHAKKEALVSGDLIKLKNLSKSHQSHKKRR